MNFYRKPDSVVSKDDLATTFRAHKAANDKGKSEQREYARRHQNFKERKRILNMPNMDDE